MRNVRREQRGIDLVVEHREIAPLGGEEGRSHPRISTTPVPTRSMPATRASVIDCTGIPIQP